MEPERKSIFVLFWVSERECHIEYTTHTQRQVVCVFASKKAQVCMECGHHFRGVTRVMCARVLNLERSKITEPHRRFYQTNSGINI